MHYLVDGYNLLFRLGISTDSLEISRDRLLEGLAASPISMTIFFDAAHNPEPYSRGHLGPLELIFTDRGQSADEAILGYLPHHGPTTVVTSDRELAHRAHLLGASTLCVEEFIRLIGKTSHERSDPSHLGDKPQKASSSELARWLKIFQKRFDELE